MGNLENSPGLRRAIGSLMGMLLLAATASGETVGVFYDSAIGQIQFAAGDIKAALESKGFTVEMLGLGQLNPAYANKKVVLALAGNSTVTTVLTVQGGTIPQGLGDQAYALRTTMPGQPSFWALGGNHNGAMYGGLQIAENIKFHGFTGTYNSQEAPTILKRGIKLNYPLDASSPTYFSDFGGTSYKLAILHVWDMAYWTAWLDEMARNRYNVLSIWNNHPFTSMVKLPEYPDVAIQNVTGFSGTTTTRIKTMTIDEKIAFWKQLMAYAHARGFEVFLFNWNIFVSNANGKYGLSNGSASAANTTYMYKSMKALLETYPDLDGFGVTNGENGSTVSFLWNAYGKAVFEFMRDNDTRKFQFIHRWHQANFSDIKSLFAPLMELKNVTFDMSFKYSEAHMYSTVVPAWWTNNDANDLTSNGLKTWFTVRNDDFYYHNWGNPEFVRGYVNGMPGKGTYFRGFYMGSDGYCPTKTFFSKQSVTQGLLEIQRQWYMFMLWGRLSYNPNTPDDVFKNQMKLRYPSVSSDNMFTAWSKASGGLPKVTELTQMELRLDFDWWPEASWSKDGFVTANTFANAGVGKGSNLCTIAASAANTCAGKKTSYKLADEIEADALAALEIDKSISATANTGLGVAKNNVKAMAFLSLYYANKIRGATYLKAGASESANKTLALGKAYCWWISYANLMDSMYEGMGMQRVDDLANWHAVDASVLKEYTDNGGTGIPNCATVEIAPALNTAKAKIGIRSLSSRAVSFQLPNGGSYAFDIFTESGARVVTMSGGQGVPGFNKIEFGKTIPTGVYTLILHSGKGAAARKRFVVSQ